MGGRNGFRPGFRPQVVRRDVPIVGQQPETPRGRYTFHVVLAVTRRGQPSEITSLKLGHTEPTLVWAHIEQAVARFAQRLKEQDEQEEKLGRPVQPPVIRIVPINWNLIDFTAQEVIDKIEALQAADAKAQDLDAKLAELRARPDSSERDVMEAFEAAQVAREEAERIAKDLGYEPAGDEPPAPEGGEQP